MLKKIVLIVTTLAAITLAPIALTGCNTVAGAGTDIKSGGEAVTDTAKDVQKKM
jgi:entericidin B